MLQRQLSRLLKVRAGEWRVVLLLQLQLFLIIAVLLIAKPAGNALFLSRYGSGSLPYMYILTALVAAGVSLSYSSALRYYSILRVNLWSSGICWLTLSLFALAIPWPGARDLLAVGLYLWVALYGVVAASQFWLVANMIFDLRQAKRLFGFVGAGGIAGGIAGGYVANLVANEYGSQVLLIVAAALLLPGIFITLYVWRRYVHGKIPKLARRRRKAELQENPFTLVRGSRHLRLLCGIVALSVIVAKLVDYQFSAMALRRFANEEQLTAFFGFWFSTFNVIGLAIQLLLTQRVVRWVGIGGSLLVLPAGLLLGSFGMLLFPGLTAATFGRAVDGSLKQSLHRAGVEMLFLPVSQEIKERIKTYIDVFIDSAAGGLGGLLLLFLVDGLGFHVAWISIPVAVLSIGWLICVLWVRDEYIEAFRGQLAHLWSARRPPSSIKRKHREVLSGFLKVLEDRQGDEREQQLLYVLEKTAETGGKEFRQPVTRLLEHESARVRGRAIRSLAIQHDHGAVEKVRKMVDDPDPEVSNAAIEYLASHFPHRYRALIDQRLNHPDPQLAGGAFCTLLQESRNNDYILMKWDLPAYFERRLAELESPSFTPEVRHAWTLQLIRASGLAAFPAARSFLRRQLEHPEPTLRHAAIVAAGVSLDECWLLRLIDFLSEAEDRPHARAALVQYGLGLIDILPLYFRNDEIDVEDVRRLPAVLARIGSLRSVELLFAMLDRYYPADLELRREAIRALVQLHRDHPELSVPARSVFRQLHLEAKRFGLVEDIGLTQRIFLPTDEPVTRAAREGFIRLLEQRRADNLERLFNLLELRYRREDIVPISIALRRSEHRQRVAALEFLETILENSLKRVIIPQLERLSRGETEVFIDNEEALLETQYVQFRRVLRGRDQRLKSATLHLVSHLPEQRYQRLLRVYARVDNIKLRNVARRGLTHWENHVHHRVPD